MLFTRCQRFQTAVLVVGPVVVGPAEIAVRLARSQIERQVLTGADRVRPFVAGVVGRLGRGGRGGGRGRTTSQTQDGAGRKAYRRRIGQKHFG